MTLLLLFFLSLQPSKPEPIDVAPITVEYGKPGHNWCDMGACTWVEGESPFGGDIKATRRTYITCADKRRFLMTAEDGSKHCILLMNPETEKSR